MYLPLNTKRALGTPIPPETAEISLDAAGLVALADLTTIQKRTALTGTATLLDMFILCPGIHMQQSSPTLNDGEYPACGAMTTGYVFRVENQATVYYLQQVSKTGHLTTLEVSKIYNPETWCTRIMSLLFSAHNTPFKPALAYAAAILWAIGIIVVMGLLHDWWALGVVLMLMASRLCNITVIRRRAQIGWTGAPEPGVHGDLIVLLSNDRWVRIKGEVDHLKAITSGQWLRDQSKYENWATAVATLVVYLAAALVSNATRFGQVLILALLGVSVGLLAVTNSTTEDLMMHGHILKKANMDQKQYCRRLCLADELIDESGRKDWALRMGMCNEDEGKWPVVM